MNKEVSQRKARALRFIVLMGLVSLFGDIVYEGARGVIGPYLALLGASAFAVGLVGVWVNSSDMLSDFFPVL